MKCFAGLLVFLPKHSSLSESFLCLQTSMTFFFFFFWIVVLKALLQGTKQHVKHLRELQSMFCLRCKLNSIKKKIPCLCLVRHLNIIMSPYQKTVQQRAWNYNQLLKLNMCQGRKNFPLHYVLLALVLILVLTEVCSARF